ncbi:MAG: HNH endonuclease signature motif containing protein [Candidatus Methylomirabilales bacterium]
MAVNTIESIFDRLIPAYGCCIVWTGSKTSAGYGNVGRKGGTSLVHRLVYEHFRGPVPEGLELDHLCRNRVCCNPDHLEAVTHRENSKRGSAGAVNAARQRAITHCPKGHPYDEANTYRSRKGSRSCRQCGRERWHRWHRRIEKRKGEEDLA